MREPRPSSVVTHSALLRSSKAQRRRSEVSQDATPLSGCAVIVMPLTTSKKGLAKHLHLSEPGAESQEPGPGRCGRLVRLEVAAMYLPRPEGIDRWLDPQPRHCIRLIDAVCVYVCRSNPEQIRISGSSHADAQ